MGHLKRSANGHLLFGPNGHLVHTCPDEPEPVACTCAAFDDWDLATIVDYAADMFDACESCYEESGDAWDGTTVWGDDPIDPACTVVCSWFANTSVFLSIDGKALAGHSPTFATTARCTTTCGVSLKTALTTKCPC